MGEGAHVTVEEGELVLALLEPAEVAARVHQPNEELPDSAGLSVQSDNDRELVDPRIFARPVDQGDVALVRCRRHSRTDVTRTA